MKINNDDPIKEVGSFRVGLDNLEENKEINSEYFHVCSNDLSDKGSIKEEIEHAKYARMKKEELLNNKVYSRNYDAINNKKSVNPIVIIVIIFIIIASILDSIFTKIEEFETANSFEYIEPEYSKSEMFEDQVSLYDSKNNILINATMAEDGSIVLDVQNNNINLLNNIKVQTIFYDINDKPIQISENNINTIFENGRHICNIYDVPESYARFEFLITQPYILDGININKEDIVMNWYKNSQNDFEMQISNNSEYEIDSIEIVAVYYKNGKIADINKNHMYDIKSGKTITDSMYNFNYSGEYDMVELIINDVYVYE